MFCSKMFCSRMCFQPKCNWCDLRKKQVHKIIHYCKWMNYYICDDCYNKKLQKEIYYPIKVK